MKTRRRKNANPVRRRRGVTLVEMLVTLAVLLLMMALVVQIFQAATGSMNAAQVYQRLDDDLRRVDSAIRSDLSGATAKFTPPNDPADNQGYFEYIENEFADNDGEDCDDSIRLTVKAPEDRPFIGRMWAKPPKVLLANGQVRQMSVAELSPQQFASQPITVTSKHAEVIYFLRNGNLYRRVLLIAPELQTKIVHSYSLAGDLAHQNWGSFPGVSPGNGVEGPLDPTKGGVQLPFTPGALAYPSSNQTSWQGVNDLSAHPSPRGTPNINQFNSVMLNSLGDLTDRHHRFAMSRFTDDFYGWDPSTSTWVYGPDGVADDLNNDAVPDWYPTLTSHVIDELLSGYSQTNQLWNVSYLNFGAFTTGYLNLRAALSFPYMYGGSYSRAESANVNTWRGWIHAPAPFASDGTNIYNYTQPEYLKYLNHNPMDLGDNLPSPSNPLDPQLRKNLQTYWGFPTWRETLAPEWNDPTFQVNQVNQLGIPAYPTGLRHLTSGEILAGAVDPTDSQLLPPMNSNLRQPNNPAMELWRGSQADPFSDGAGSNTGFFNVLGGKMNLWNTASWEDDLLLTNVRSFDVKAFEPALADYADLGWGDDYRVTAGATSTNPGTTTLASVNLGTGQFVPYIGGVADANIGSYSSNSSGYPYDYYIYNQYQYYLQFKGTAVTPYAFIHGRAWDVLNQTFAHEGRMPPLRRDWRFDAQFGPALPRVDPSTGNFGAYYPTHSRYDGNVGDDSAAIVRMRRTWDSWSTTYSKAVATGVTPGIGFPYGPPFTPPINPSYPPPYPAPLRGIQIQVRVTDPTNQRIKVLTIRQDFTDKL